MKRWAKAGLIGLVACASALAMVVPASAQSSNEKAKATEVGVTAGEVHIAIVADVDNALAPGLFKGAELGVEGAAKYLNSKAGGGGVAGRKLVVDFIDSKLNPTTSRNAVISACNQDFAMVGTAVIFLSNVDDQVNCKDQAGATTGLPDIAGFAAGLAQSCSPLTFPVNGVQIDCATVDQVPQTYFGNQGAAKYLTKKFGKLHGVYIYGADTKDASRAGNVIIQANIAGGIASDQTVGVSARDPQSAYTPFVVKMKQDGSNYGTAVGDPQMINLRTEAQLQGLPSNVVWSCICYSKTIATTPVMDNTWVNTVSLPFEDAAVVPMMKTFLKYVGAANADQYSVYGWSATLAFSEAANAVVAKQGVNGLTRKAFLDTGLPTLTKFNAGGLIGTLNVSSKRNSTCFIELHLQNGKYARVFPAKKGSFDCNPANRAIIKADLLGK
jgi:hypothetical protein